jgi:hypothetical protein
MDTRLNSASGSPAVPASSPARPRHRGARVAGFAATMGGGLVVVAGAVLSLALAGTGPHRIGWAAALGGVVFGVVLAGLGAALWAVPRRYADHTAVTTFGLAGLGAVAFAVTGLRLFGASALGHTAFALDSLLIGPWLTSADLNALTRHQPAIGTVVAVAGCLAAALGAAAARQHRRP